MLSQNREKQILVVGIIVLLGSLGVFVLAVLMIFFSSTQVASQTFEPITVDGPFPAILGVVADNKLKVFDVMSGSAADRTGLQRDDIIIELGGQSFRGKNFSLEQAKQEVLNITDTHEGQRLSITINRHGQEVTLPIQPTRYNYSIPLTPLPKNLIHI